MSSTLRDVPFGTSDFDLFGQDISPADYEFFKKHTGAFKRLLQDQSKEKKQAFVDAFKDFSLRHGCLKDCPTKNDNIRLSYVDEAALVYKESFVNGKFSTAKNIVMDAVILAQNKHLLQYMGAKSYSKDPFFHKETRDVFRRLFGLPSLNGTFMKVICVLPLHIRFGGSICRYLRRWLDAESVKSLPPQPTEPRKTFRASAKKKEKEAKPKEESLKREEVIKLERYIRTVFEHNTDANTMEQVRAAFESIDFPGFNKDDTAEEKPAEEEAKKPADKGLTLSEHLGVASKDNDKKTKGKDDDQYSLAASCLLRHDKKVAEEREKHKSTHVMDHIQSLEATADGKVSIITKPSAGKYKSPRESVDCSYEEIEEMLLFNKPHPNEEIERLIGKSLSPEHDLKLKQCKENAEKTRIEHEAFLKAKRAELEITKQNVIKRRKYHGFLEPVEIPGITYDINIFGHRISSKPQVEDKKRHACANCRKVEPGPKTFKKCQRCKGKRTRFYCSKTCQENDWVVSHRDDHNSIEDVT